MLAVRQRTGATIEVLTPDFNGRTDCIDRVLSARPEVFNHNIETVARLQQQVRRKSQYGVSLEVLRHVKAASPTTRTKSGLMLGLGETTEELLETLADLRSIGCDFLTLGQYLQPSPRHLRSRGIFLPRNSMTWAELPARSGSRKLPAGPSSAPATMPMRW